MTIWRKADLVSLLRDRVRSAPSDGPDWRAELIVACAMQDMDAALDRAGLNGGEEPTERPIRP